MPGDKGLIQDVRPASAEITGQQRELFAFDAFEYEDPNKNDPAKITVKEGWKLNLQRAVIGDTDLSVDGSFLNVDLIEAGAINASKIDVTDLFAQDITATGTITGVTIIGGNITGTSSISIGPFVVTNDGAIQNIRFRNTDNLLFDNKTYAISATEVEEWQSSPTSETIKLGTGIEEPGSTWVRFNELANIDSISGTPANFFADNIAVGRINQDSWLRVSQITGRSGSGTGGALIIRPARNGLSPPNTNEEIYTFFGTLGPQWINGGTDQTVAFVNTFGLVGAVFN